MPSKPNEPTKDQPSFIEDIPGEMTMAEARVYLERGFKVLAELAEDTSKESNIRLAGARGILAYYDAIAMPATVEGLASRAERASTRMSDTVRKLRPKKEDWEDADAE